MAGKAARLPEGIRISDEISLGVLAKTFPATKVKEVLKATGRQSARQRDLPAQVMVYYVIAMALYMRSSCREVLRCLLEGIKRLLDAGTEFRVAGRGGISQARERLGWEPMRQLHDQLVTPIAGEATRGAWYRRWRVVSLDGSTLDLPDTKENARAFGRPGASRGKSAFPQLRFVSLVENGTHVLFASQVDGYHSSETTLAEQAVVHLKAGMLCLADRQFFGFDLWNQARGTGADLLWRVKKNLRLPCEKRLPDGSYLSRVYGCQKDRRHGTNGVIVRVIEYRLKGVAGAEPIYRLLTTILDWEQAPAKELAALYHERWGIETALGELKTQLRDGRIVLRSKRPDLVRQEFYGFLMAHFAIRGLMHEAALKADEEPDRLSFLHAVRVVRRRLAEFATIPPLEAASLA